jgi:hypothetical protein
MQEANTGREAFLVEDSFFLPDPTVRFSSHLMIRTLIWEVIIPTEYVKVKSWIKTRFLKK